MQVLITVKTYPHPSVRYQETVCTAGITSTGEWIRLYPLRFRHLPEDVQFDKYQWISIDVERNAPKDPRPESYRPNMASIRLGEKLGTKNDWADRKAIVLKRVMGSVEELRDAWDRDRTSLATVKPASVEDLVVERSDTEWDPKYYHALNQVSLFGDTLTLEKVPLDFKYIFRCNDPRCKGHKLTITDWEIHQAYRKWRHHYGHLGAIKAIKKKWLEEMWDPQRDSYLFLGNRGVYPTFLVVGVFWPPVGHWSPALF